MSEELRSTDAELVATNYIDVYVRNRKFSHHKHGCEIFPVEFNTEYFWQ